jgi:hypothetical protein
MAFNEPLATKETLCKGIKEPEFAHLFIEPKKILIKQENLLNKRSDSLPTQN